MKRYSLKNIMLGIKEHTVWANTLAEAKQKAIANHAQHNDNHVAYWIKNKSKF